MVIEDGGRQSCMLTSVMAQSARMALGRYWSSFPVMSFVRLREKKWGRGDMSVREKGNIDRKSWYTHTCLSQ